MVKSHKNIEQQKALDYIVKVLSDTCVYPPKANISLDEKAFLKRLRHHRLNSLLVHSKGYRPEHLTPNLAKRLNKLDQKNRLQMMRLSSELIKIGELFKSHNIPFIVLKGPALSQQIYGDYTLRNSRDIDILVKERDISKAHQILLSINYSLTTSFSSIERFNHKELKYEHNNSKLLVELHHRLFNNKYLLPLTEDIFNDKIYIDLDGYKTPILDHSTNYLYLIVHAAAHNWKRLQWSLDLVTFRGLLSPKELDKVKATADALGLTKIYHLSSNMDIKGFASISRETHYILIRRFVFLLGLNATWQYKQHEILHRLLTPYRFFNKIRTKNL